jgi:hypothetical protein
VWDRVLVQVEKDLYQGIASAMPTKGSEKSGFSRWVFSYRPQRLKPVSNFALRTVCLKAFPDTNLSTLIRVIFKVQLYMVPESLHELGRCPCTIFSFHNE